MAFGFDPAAVRRTRLVNGLTVLLHRDPAAPVVAINTYVKAGYFDETDDVVGIAHVLEHMYFKGTARRGVGEISKATKAVGGYLNAHTIYDHTSYYAVLPASSLADGLDIQADAYANSVIDAGELAKELEVIIQEANRKADNPGAVTTETLYALLHDTHRIRRWRIGREAALRTLTRTQLLSFYHNFYSPANTVLSISGDLDIDGTMAMVQRLYGDLPAHDPVRTPGQREVEHDGFRYGELDGDVAQTQVAMGWRTVGTAHPDTPALDVVGSVLSAGRASRLYRAVRERKLAGSAGAYHYTPVEVGVFVMDAESDPETARAAAGAMWDQLRLVRAGDVNDDELERSRRLFDARWTRRLETAEGRAAYLAEWEAQGGWERGQAYYDAVMAVTADDITRVAQEYLTPERAGVVVYRPRGTPLFADDPSAMRALLDGAIALPLDPSPPPAPPTAGANANARFVREEGGVRVYETAQGIPVLIAVRPTAAVSYMGIYAAGGACDESEARAGITALAARTVVKGTNRYSAVEIAELGERLGGSVSSSVGAESFGWSISVPRSNSSAAIALLGHVVSDAALSDASVETERTALRSELAQLRDDMYRYPMRLLQNAAFPDHPYGTPTLGTDETVRGITSDEARSWYRERLREAPFVIAVVGAVDPDVMAAEAARAFDGLVMGERRMIAAPSWPSALVQRAESREKAQTALAVAFAAPSRRDEGRFAARMVATIASGLGGRFFDELRDRQSLAYTVHAFVSEHSRAGLFVSYIATSPDREAIARDGLLREFQRLRDEPVTPAELANAKRYLVGMHDIRQERGGAVLGDIVDAWLSGGGLHELDEYVPHVNAVSADDILALARRDFDPARRVEGIVRGTGVGGAR